MCPNYGEPPRRAFAALLLNEADVALYPSSPAVSSCPAKADAIIAPAKINAAMCRQASKTLDSSLPRFLEVQGYQGPLGADKEPAARDHRHRPGQRAFGEDPAATDFAILARRRLD